MLFWIWVIIAGISFIGALCFGEQSKEEKEYQHFYRAKDRAYDNWTFTPFDIDKRCYEQLKGEYLNAKAALSTFEDEHPKRTAKTQRREYAFNTSMCFLIGALIVALIMGGVLSCIYISAPADQVEKEAEYEVLLWEVENDIYTDNGDDVVGKKETYNQVREWNSTLAREQAKAKDFWVGIFTPDYWLDLKPIELK